MLKEGRSLYVDRKGLAVSPLRDMLRKVSRQESVQAERERLVRESLAPVEPVVDVVRRVYFLSTAQLLT